MMSRLSFARFALATAATALSLTGVAGQEKFQFYVAATDDKGQPVTDLKVEDVMMSENGQPATILQVEPFRMPVKLTIAIDNGSESREPLAHYRSGLTAMIEAFPSDLEVTVVSTAPQPRVVQQSTANRQQILRGINGFAPEDERPRFTDALVEYSQRLEKDLQKRKVVDEVPVLLMISTTNNEVTSYQQAEIGKALGFMQARKARLYVVITSGKAPGDASAAADINTNRQALIAIPATKATRGKFEAISVSSRLATLLPEFGKEIAALHKIHVNQFKVTAQRPEGLKGPLQNPRIELKRQGLNGAVSPEGIL